MRQEPRVGARVRVREGYKIPHLVGRVGTVTRAYRSSERTALHVRFGDGRWQLLWPEEVEGAEGDPEAETEPEPARGVR